MRRLLVVLVVAVVAGAAAGAPSWAQKGPIKVGLLVPQTGSLAANGKDVRRVEKVNGRLQNTVIHTFPNVSQFWTHKPEEVRKAPAYPRDYPPCKAC